MERKKREVKNKKGKEIKECGRKDIKKRDKGQKNGNSKEWGRNKRNKRETKMERN
jgi:hypothetical protein